MTVYSGPVFDMTVIADHLSIPIDKRDGLMLPKRAITIFRAREFLP
jgi:glutamate dehydrogenase (NAD(P)+)